MLARKFVSYDYIWQGYHKTNWNALFSLWSLKAGKVLVRLDQNEEKKEKKLTWKK